MKCLLHRPAGIHFGIKMATCVNTPNISFKTHSPHWSKQWSQYSPEFSHSTDKNIVHLNFKSWCIITSKHANIQTFTYGGFNFTPREHKLFIWGELTASLFYLVLLPIQQSLSQLEWELFGGCPGSLFLHPELSAKRIRNSSRILPAAPMLFFLAPPYTSTFPKLPKPLI